MPGPFAIEGFNQDVFTAGDQTGSGYQKSLVQVIQNSGNAVELSIHLTQATLTSTNPTIDAGYLTDLGQAIDTAKAAGLNVTVKPLTQVTSDPGQWQNMAPTDPAAWFASYKADLIAIADVAQQHGAQTLLLGNEIGHMTTPAAYLPFWTDIISTLRQHFSGQLSYNAAAGEFNEYQNVTFWNQLDFVGLSYDPNLNSNATQHMSVQDYVSAFTHDAVGTDEVAAITAFQAKLGKPIEFTEVDHPPFIGSYLGLNSVSPQVSLTDQVNFYEATMEVWGTNTPSWLKGMQPYQIYSNANRDLEGVGAANSPWTFSLADKPAAWVIQAWYSGAVTSGSQVTMGDTSSSTITLKAGNQLAFSGDSSHQIVAGTGNDTLVGGTGTDVLVSGAGTDTLVAGTGTTIMIGGSGATTYVIPGTAGSRAVIYNVHTGVDQFVNNSTATSVVFVQSHTVGVNAAELSLIDTSYYLTHNVDVALAAADPIQHFIQSGVHEGRNPDAFFDVSYYLAHNPDIAAAGIDPLLHYATFGWREGRDPSAAFSTTGYLSANPDVKLAGIDPLQHYLMFGLVEGRPLGLIGHSPS